MYEHNIDQIVNGYLEAVVFTEQHSDMPENLGLELAESFVWEVRRDVCRLLSAMKTAGLSFPGEERQLGIDLWFTRNGHGTGFWDRPEVYGEHKDALTAFAKLMGEHDAEFE